MILGIGTDVVAVARLREALERHGERFAARVLGEEELAEYRGKPDPAAFLAKRFAAKEATAKAFGTGFRDGLALRHIRVVSDTLGRPSLHFTGPAEERARALGVTAAHVSLSDERDVAVAFVVIEG